MSFNGKKKESPRILTNDMYRYIAKASNGDLTVKQVKECFDIYYQLLFGLVNNEHKSDKIELCLPKIGKFYFIKKKGNKKGTKFKLPDLTDENYTQQIVEIQEDEPDYELIKFKINKEFKERVRKVTSRWEDQN